jgi:hypothetical protein
MNRNNVIELQDLVPALRSVAGFQVNLADDMETDMDNGGSTGAAEAIYTIQVLSGRRATN